jgi:hypothetical protein
MTRTETNTKCGAEPLTAESHTQVTTIPAVTVDGLPEVMGNYL